MEFEMIFGIERSFKDVHDKYLTAYRGIGHINTIYSELPSALKFQSAWAQRNYTLVAERRPITDEQEKTLEKTRELLSDLLIPSNPNFEDAPKYRGAPITDESELNECIGQQSQDDFIDDFVTFGKYDRQCKGVVIDVYDVLQAFEVVNPALQHLIKKALCAGLRGHKKREQDLVEILESAKRAIELEGK